MLFAILDLGANTIRMVIYRKTKQNEIEQIYKQKQRAELALYIQNEILQQEGIDLACQILKKYVNFLKTFSIEKIYGLAAAALRNIKNSQEVLTIIKNETGVQIHVLTGEEEAQFSFMGALPRINTLAENPRGIFFDLGGGSTELVFFQNEKILQKTSVPVGSLLLAKQFPNPKKQFQEIQQFANEVLKNFSLPEKNLLCIGVGGTIKSLQALYKVTYFCKREKPQNLFMNIDSIDKLIQKYLFFENLTEKDVSKLLIYGGERMKTIFQGMIFASSLARHFQCSEIIYCETGVREGFLQTHFQ